MRFPDLSIIYPKEVLPIRGIAWNRVLARHEEWYQMVQRNVVSLQWKFAFLSTIIKFPQVTQPGCPENVRQAK
jgi:hypothetical protein